MSWSQAALVLCLASLVVIAGYLWLTRKRPKRTRTSYDWRQDARWRSWM